MPLTIENLILYDEDNDIIDLHPIELEIFFQSLTKYIQRDMADDNQRGPATWYILYNQIINWLATKNPDFQIAGLTTEQIKNNIASVDKFAKFFNRKEGRIILGTFLTERVFDRYQHTEFTKLDLANPNKIAQCIGLAYFEKGTISNDDNVEDPNHLAILNKVNELDDELLNEYLSQLSLLKLVIKNNKIYGEADHLPTVPQIDFLTGTELYDLLIEQRSRSISLRNIQVAIDGIYRRKAINLGAKKSEDTLNHLKELFKTKDKREPIISVLITARNAIYELSNTEIRKAFNETLDDLEKIAALERPKKDSDLYQPTITAILHIYSLAETVRTLDSTSDPKMKSKKEEEYQDLRTKLVEYSDRVMKKNLSWGMKILIQIAKLFSFKVSSFNKTYQKIAALNTAYERNQQFPEFQIIQSAATESATISSLGKITSFKSKSSLGGGAKSSGKYSGRYTYITAQQQELCGMIKQGNILGETLAELLGYLELQEYIGKDDHQFAAPTYLVLAPTTNKNETTDDFCKRIYVLSQYNEKSYASVEALKLALCEDRPNVASTFHPRIFSELNKQNNVCNLKLEVSLAGAATIVDYDAHLGNNMLCFELEHIKDPARRALAMELITEMLQDLKKRAVRSTINKHFAFITHIFKYELGLSSDSYSDHWQQLNKKILHLKSLGVKAHYQKIDHGLAYHRMDTRKGYLDSSLLGTKDGYKPSGGASNHIAEYFENERAQLLASTDTFCRLVEKNTIEVLIKNRKTALHKCFAHINKLAQQHSDKHGRAAVELQLLQALHKHITGNEWEFEIEDTPVSTIITVSAQVEAIKKVIETYTTEKGEEIARVQQTQYLKFLEQAMEAVRLEIRTLPPSAATASPHLKEALYDKLSRLHSAYGKLSSQINPSTAADSEIGRTSSSDIQFQTFNGAR